MTADNKDSMGRSKSDIKGLTMYDKVRS